MILFAIIIGALFGAICKLIDISIQHKKRIEAIEKYFFDNGVDL